MIMQTLSRTSPTSIVVCTYLDELIDAVEFVLFKSLFGKVAPEVRVASGGLLSSWDLLSLWIRANDSFKASAMAVALLAPPASGETTTASL